MTLFHRRILTILFLVSFFVVTPLLVYYTSGYRYNFELKKIQRTGLLHVTADPQHSKMILNGQPYNIGKELVLKSLKPAEYEIIILKDGYHSWFKTLEIKPGESTFIRDLTLFYEKEAIPKEIFTSPLTFIKKTPELAIFQSNNFLFIYRYDDQSIIEIEVPANTTIEEVSIDSGQLSFNQDSDWFMINYEDSTLKNITGYLPDETRRVISQNNTLYLLTDTGIWTLDKTEKDYETILVYKQSLPQDILFSDKDFWVIATEPSKKRSFLYHIANTNSRPRLITSLPYAEVYDLKENYNGFLTIHDKSENKLHLVDTSTEPATTATLNNVHTWEWSKDHTQLLTATDLELTIHHFQNGRHQELLRRISTPITDAFWYSDERYVFFATNDTLSLVERDDRNERNVYLLSEDKKDLQILYVDPDGEKIIFSSMNGNAGGAIWELSLTE